MKQIIQDWKTGETRVEDVPAPKLKPGWLLIQTRASLISAGTERRVVEFAEKSLVGKAKARPDLVLQVLEKMQRDGVLPVMKAAMNRLDQPIPLGYSSAGVVSEVGDGVEGFRRGDRVACAGGGYAVHAEIACVPRNLVVRLPAGMPFEQAAFGTLGGIALQGVRLADVSLCEVVAVIGLGLIGQITIQLLKAAGAVVIGMDLSEERAELATALGADAVAVGSEEFSKKIEEVSGGSGADKILISAATSSDEPVALAGQVARDRAVVVAVGAVGMTIPRKVYYQKELDFKISRSYGPGRYDPQYEEGGVDYPIGYVRWTENRNIQAFLHLLSEGKLAVESLISHRFALADAGRAYDLVKGKAKESSLGIVLEYPREPDRTTRIDISEGFAVKSESVKRIDGGIVRLGFLGAGSFANGVLLPAFRKTSGVELVGIASERGINAKRSAGKFGFRYCTSDERQIIDGELDAVVIATRHHLHGRQALEALEAGKHVFVEKPLATTLHDLEAVERRLKTDPSKILFVGFNRRFAPLSRELKKFFDKVQEPLLVQYRVNAGYIPGEHWTQDPEQGGGRIVGEVCHFVDFSSWLVGASPTQLRIRGLPNGQRYNDDNIVLTLTFDNGSIATIIYVACGDKALGKENIEVHGGGKSAVLDDFRKLRRYADGKVETSGSRWRQDKGHGEECRVFVEALLGLRPCPILPLEISTTTRITLLASRCLRDAEFGDVPVTSVLVNEMNGSSPGS